MRRLIDAFKARRRFGRQLRGKLNDDASEAQSAPIATISGEDPSMQAAIDAARMTLDAFLDQVCPADGVTGDGACLKVAVPTDGPVSVEHVWVGPFKKQDHEFAGILNQHPHHFDHPDLGTPLTFAYEQITDWGFIDLEGRHFGNYTTRLIATRVPTQARA